MSEVNLDNEKFFLQLIHCGKLKVTEDGRAFNLITGREIGKAGAVGCYRKLSWQNPHTRKIIQIQLHRLVWAVFNGIPDDGLVVNHIDGNKQNCALCNLEITTPQGNSQHAVANRLVYINRGEDNHNAIFTDEEVRYLRKQFATGRLTIKAIADKYRCHRVTVFNMLRGTCYSSVSTKYDDACHYKLPHGKRGM